jgi:hypothetical protein
MPGVYANLAQIMASREMSVSRTPFNPDIAVIKRASFRKGEVPAHLEGYLIKSGECKGETGTVVYKGRLVPKTAACVAEKHAGKRASRRRRRAAEE